MPETSSTSNIQQLAVLAIDTAFDECSVALTTTAIRDVCYSKRPRKHADDVLPLVQSLLHKHQQSMASINVIAMINGPGSFTGLRIGAAVTQGLAFGTSCPVVCISSLAIMAYDSLAKSEYNNTDQRIFITVCVHARESEFYFAVYSFDSALTPIAEQRDQILDAESLKNVFKDFMLSRAEQPIPSIWIGAGQGWAHDLLVDFQSMFDEILIAPECNALLLADLAIKSFYKGLAINPEAATPVYLNDDMQYKTV
ncbi:MAG: tRNA (adenosine(37)-N6)-threonylcarbamoyltransferase complex dimerization subunit type 1 TsaB [Pseudohongiella sp.]|nr:tRNA (adenosine(37)-N6)-threonylcarbamoyltransferase complex dimerization subunit type 1 TsaB [Pseudohongiella sp.]